MPSVCFYFQVHQPRRVKRYRVFDIGHDPHYFNDDSDSNLNNAKIIRKVADKCYLPTNKLLLDLLKRHPEFKVSFSLSGVVLEQFEEAAPEVLESFQQLVQTGRVELLAETYYHSLAYLYSPQEFRRQVKKHQQKIFALFGCQPTVFRHTELVYNNALAEEVAQLGFKGILAEGADHILGERSPNFVYQPVNIPGLKALLKNYRLSDDLAFRFSSRAWSDWPLPPKKFASWISAINGSGQLVNLFLDYETFGEHQWAETGIFDFLAGVPAAILKHPDNDFVTVSEAIKRYPARDQLDAPHFYSWADTERDLSAWLENELQQNAARELYDLEDIIQNSHNPQLLENWRRLQTSDHLYYMCTKWWNDGDVHKYFSPFESPYDAYIAFMNALGDLKLRARPVGEITQHV